MRNTLLQSALKLSKSQRILLAEQIWDSVAEGQDIHDLTDAQKREIDHRLARLRRTGSLGASFDEVKKRVTKMKSRP